jgi:hypothetical protein
MYKSIYVPVDNSDHSNRAVACALGLGKAYSARLVGCHVYAAKLHDYRFRQMEYTLPEEYIDEVELERQRKIHDSLITMGLKLISDSYLDGMSRLCGLLPGARARSHQGDHDQLESKNGQRRFDHRTDRRWNQLRFHVE